MAQMLFEWTSDGCAINPAALIDKKSPLNPHAHFTVIWASIWFIPKIRFFPPYLCIGGKKLWELKKFHHLLLADFRLCDFSATPPFSTAI